MSIVLLILLSITTLITLQLYTINRANATNQNQQIITTESPAITTTALLPKTSNNSTTTTQQTVAAPTTTTDIPSAESVYTSQSITLPPTVKSFVWYIVDEAHENTDTSSRKKVSDHNPDYLPTNVVMSKGTSLVFLDADAPWDSPHPHTINILESSTGNIVYSTGKLDYTNSSKPTTLPVGKYEITDIKYPWMKGTLTITDNNNVISGHSSSNLIIG